MSFGYFQNKYSFCLIQEKQKQKTAAGFGVSYILWYHTGILRPVHLLIFSSPLYTPGQHQEPNEEKGHGLFLQHSLWVKLVFMHLQPKWQGNKATAWEAEFCLGVGILAWTSMTVNETIKALISSHVHLLLPLPGTPSAALQSWWWWVGLTHSAHSKLIDLNTSLAPTTICNSNYNISHSYSADLLA